MKWIFCEMQWKDKKLKIVSILPYVCTFLNNSCIISKFSFSTARFNGALLIFYFKFQKNCKSVNFMKNHKFKNDIEIKK